VSERRTMSTEPIDRWLDALASGLIEPAAEAFASLAAAGGAALVAAVARRGALHFAEPHATRMVEIQLEADAAREALHQLADSNAAAYESFLEILRAGAEREADRTSRLVALSEALETTIDGQLQTARRAVYLMGIADEVTRAGDANTAADGLSAAAALHAATVAATADIEINAFAVAEPARRAELAETCASLRGRAAALLTTVEDSFHAASTTT
jgi:formiminotetrahydrofolate cyclodeaminase